MDKKTMLDELRGEFGTMEEAAQHFQTSREILYQSLNGKGARAVRVALAKYFNVYPSQLWQDNTRARVLDDHEMTERTS